jgi:CHAT domain-containing protein/Tfp pilus assembly protein PilF
MAIVALMPGLPEANKAKLGRSPSAQWKDRRAPLLRAGFVVCLSVILALTALAAAQEEASPEKSMQEGLIAFQRGNFQEAVVSWTRAASAYGEAGRPENHTEALIRLAEAYQSLGLYRRALQSLRLALDAAEKSGDRAQKAMILGSLGNAYVALGIPRQAQDYMTQALRAVEEIGDPILSASILNNLGNSFTESGRYSQAIEAYKRSLKLSDQTDPAMAATAEINAVRALILNEQYQEAKAFADEALARIQSLPQSHDKVFGLMSLALAYDDLRSHFPDMSDFLLKLANKTFTEAYAAAEAIGDVRGQSYALGYRGKLYEGEHRYEDALQLTRRAVFAAQQANAPESLYRWQWQTGRLLKALGKIDEAIAAYRRAVYTLQSIRPEMAVGYGNRKSSFRQTAGPVYFELVDLLLKRTDSLPQPGQSKPYLIEARDTVELFKAAELRDYFEDDCVDAAQSRSTELDVVSAKALIIYPIVLQDRTELLITSPKGLKRFTVPVGHSKMTPEVREFRRKLEKRTTREYLLNAQKLYDWLIRPLETELQDSDIDTLVFVPDGALRTIPMAALHDGKRFLIEKYAVATTPSLDLTDPRPVQRKDSRVFVAGLTDPVQGFSALPHVARELEAIKRLYGSDPVVNEQFVIPNIEGKLGSEPYNIVHIATHGEFKSDVGKSFLLTFDDRLTMDSLDQYVGLFRFREDPLELLTLSACATAAGDDRAALGLAGIAIKAGARSALATLWYINDQASSLLVENFYEELKNPSVSRAVALQRAQLSLLNDKLYRYRHPGSWSAFLLINNWL